jgi:hypothetical protein
MIFSIHKIGLVALVICLFGGRQIVAQEIVLYPDSLNLNADPNDSEVFTLAIRAIGFDEIAGINLRLEFGGGIIVDSAYFAPGVNVLPGSFLLAGNTLNLVFLTLDPLGTTLPDEAVFFFIRLRFPDDSGNCQSMIFTELEAVKASDPTNPAPSRGINADICPITAASISGRITYPGSGSPLEHVQLEAVSTDSTFGVASDAIGTYLFEDLPAPNEYSVVPLTKTDETDRARRLRGVNVADMVVMQRHILGTAAFSSPYQYIAADINADGQITTADLIALQGYLLFRTDSFADNTSWRFIDAAYTFAPDDPLQGLFPEFISTGILRFDQASLDFIGVKIGDANLDAY